MTPTNLNEKTSLHQLAYHLITYWIEYADILV